MKNFKKYTAIAVAATMTIGSAMTVFAGDVTPGVSEGEGSYEGGEMKYPTLTVTLPTIPAGTYDYIADPNGDNRQQICGFYVYWRHRSILLDEYGGRRIKDLYTRQRGAGIDK